MTRALTKAPVVTPPEEARMERFAHLVVFGEDGDGGGLSVSAAARKLGLDAKTGKRWWASKPVQDYVRSALDALRQGTEAKLGREVDLALQTLHNAMVSPEYKRHQVDAAKAVLSYHLRSRGSEEPSVALQVVVNTSGPADAAEAQRLRFERKAKSLSLPSNVADGEYSELE